MKAHKQSFTPLEIGRRRRPSTFHNLTDKASVSMIIKPRLLQVKTLSLTGFTLAEVLITLIIVGILATLGISRYAAAVERSRGAEAVAMLLTIYRGYQTAMAENPVFDTSASFVNLSPVSTDAAWNAIMMNNPNYAARAWFSYWVFDNAMANPNPYTAEARRRTGTPPFAVPNPPVNAARFVRIDLRTGDITSSGHYAQ